MKLNLHSAKFAPAPTSRLLRLFTTFLWVFFGGGLVESGSAQEDFRPPQVIDGSRAPEGAKATQDPPPTNPAASQVPDQKAQGEQVFEVLVQELMAMIPKKLDRDSEARKAIEGVVTAFQLREFKRAGELLDDIVTQNPGFPPADLLKATLSYAVRDAKNGLALLEKVATDHPRYPGVYAALARLALNEGRISDSLALFEKCARLIKDAELDDEGKKFFEQQCLDGMIDIAMRQRRFADARSFLERQITSLPEDPKVLMSFAELEFFEKNIDKSLDYLNKVKAKLPAARAGETIVAAWFDQQGDRENAAKWIKLAGEKYPQDPQVLLEYAAYLINIEDFPKASGLIGEAEKLSNESLFSRNLKARIAFCNMSYGISKIHYKVLAESQENNFDPANMYVLSLIESTNEEDRKLAQDVATRTFRSLPDNVIALATLGYVQLKVGDLEQAKTIFGKLAPNTGMSPEIDYFLASFYEATGEKDKATQLLETVVKREGMFLYRKPAKQLLEKIKKASDSLPTPQE
jgi:tetratricopeptide (TPR) repeat protein